MLKKIGHTLVIIQEVMRNWRYFVLASVSAMVLFVFVIWLPNLSFVGHIITSPFFTTSQKFSLLLGSLEAFKTNIMPFGRITLVISSVLFGINIGLFGFYAKSRVSLQKEAGFSLGGTILGILGVGCASCGSFILTSVLGTGASVALVGSLPFEGHEFSIFGIIIIGISIVLTAKKIEEPLICK